MVDQMKNLKSSQWRYKKLIGLRILLNLKCLSQFKYDISYNGQSITSLQLWKILLSMQINVLQLQGNFVWNDFGLFHRLLNKTKIYATWYFANHIYYYLNMFANREIVLRCCMVYLHVIQNEWTSTKRCNWPYSWRL